MIDVNLQQIVKNSHPIFPDLINFFICQVFAKTRVDVYLITKRLIVLEYAPDIGFEFQFVP